jgi:multiple sugar transport system ATP-binding protein
MSRITLRGLRKSYGATPVLRDVELTIEAGEFCVFVGPSGCGKSTLLRIIAGLEDPDAGTIEIDGTIANELPPAQRHVAMVFQSYALYPHMSAYENMAFGVRQRGVTSAEVDARVREAASMLELAPLLERKPRELSGGQRQRVAIGRAIVRKPNVFLFDEPLSNLDASLRLAMRMRIAQLHRELASPSMIYVTHDQVEAMTLADRIVLMRPLAQADGAASVAQVGAPLDLYHRPANRFVAGFIGAPAMNFLEGRVVAAAPTRVDIRVVEQVLPAVVDGTGVRSETPITLGIRPEHVVLGSGSLRGRVTYVERLGESSTVHVRLAGDLALLAKTPREDIETGDELQLDLPQEALHAFATDGTALPRIAGAARSG